MHTIGCLLTFIIALFIAVLVAVRQIISRFSAFSGKWTHASNRTTTLSVDKTTAVTPRIGNRNSSNSTREANRNSLTTTKESTSILKKSGKNRTKETDILTDKTKRTKAEALVLFVF